MRLRILVVIVTLIFIGKVLMKSGPVALSATAVLETGGIPYAADKPKTREYEAQFFSVDLPGQIDYKKFKELGISKIILRIFQDEETGGGLLFKNSLFFTSKPLLEQIITEFSSPAADMDLCAWMITRKFKWVNNTSLFDYQYRNGQREMIQKFDLFNPAALDLIVRIYQELAGKKIACILIQDDLILRYNEGFSNWGKAAFASAAQLPAREHLMMQTNTPYHLKWTRVKISQINKVLAAMVNACKVVNPGIKIGMNIYYETPIYPDKAAAWYAHSLREILETGVDYIYLMSYHRQIKQELRLSESDNRILFWRIIDRAYQVCKDKLIVKLQIRDWQTGSRIPAPEIKAYLDIIPLQVQRICFTPVKPGDYDYLREILKR